VGCDIDRFFVVVIAFVVGVSIGVGGRRLVGLLGSSRSVGLLLSRRFFLGRGCRVGGRSFVRRCLGRRRVGNDPQRFLDRFERVRCGRQRDRVTTNGHSVLSPPREPTGPIQQKSRSIDAFAPTSGPCAGSAHVELGKRWASALFGLQTLSKPCKIRKTGLSIRRNPPRASILTAPSATLCCFSPSQRAWPPASGAP
jgi:hypothetical protein